MHKALLYAPISSFRTLIATLLKSNLPPLSEPCTWPTSPLLTTPFFQMHTLYVNHINEKIARNKLARVLRRLFGRYGNVVQVTCHTNLKMKGQAFVTFQDAHSSEKAMAKLQNYPLFKQPITIAPAKSESDEILLQMGKKDLVEERKREKERRNKEREEAVEKTKTTSKASSAKLTKSQVKYWKSLPPHSVLLIQNLQDEHLPMLETMFSNFTSFETVRAIPSRKLAFINFENEDGATACLEKFDTSKLGPDVLLTYAKR